MPGLQVGVYPGQLTAGTQVSSSGEGRVVTVLESELIHPYHSDGFVDKGDPVILCKTTVPTTYGRAVGIALLSGSAASDKIPVDTEGIWNLTCYGQDDDGTRAIEIGDELYIRAGALVGAADADGTGDAEISKMRNLVTQVFFGYAYGRMEANSSGRIAVKVHASPEEQQEERITFEAGVAADDAKRFLIQDAKTIATGLSRGLCVDFTNSGVKTGNAEVNGLCVDMAILAAVPYAYAQTIYIYGTGNPTIALVAGISLYIADMGNAVVNNFALDLQFALTSIASTRGAFARLRKHSTGTPTCCFFLQADNNQAVATYFIDTGQNNETDPVAPAENTGTDYTPTYKVRCRYDATDFYLTGVAEA